MKKKLLFFIFLANCLVMFASPTTQQTSYRWRNDDGNQTTATWKATNNTASTVNLLDAPIRVRLQTLNPDAASSISFQVNPLQYSKNSGAWVSISNATTNDFYFINSTNIATNTVTTQQISTGSFTAGVFKSENSSNSITLNGDTRTETEYSIAPSLSYDKTATYRFRISGLTTYTVYPTLDPNPSYCSTTKPVVSDVFYNLNEVAVPLTASGTNLLWYSAATGGTGSTTAPTPNTSTSGITSYWVSSTNGCESLRSEVLVTVYSTSPATHLNFGGTTDYVNCGNSPSLQITGTAITLEAYVKFNTFGATSFLGNIINKDELAITSGYMLRAGGNGIVNFVVGNNGWNEIFSPNNSISLNTWHHIAGVYDGVNMRIFIDGVQVASQPLSITIGNANVNLNIGKDPSYSDRFIDASIDDVRIWNVARTAAQLNGSKNCELQGTETGLVAYYKFNQGIDFANNSAITTLTDATANGNNGTLTNITLTGTTSNFLAGSPVTTGSIVPSNATVTTPVVYNQGATATALTATPGTNGTGLVWYTTATGGIGTTAPTPSTATAGNTSYWVASTNANGCESVRTEIVVTINSSAVVSCFVTIQTGDSHSLAIANNGTLWSWGLNSSGQLGLGDTTTRTSPVQVGTETNWVSISSEGSHALAIKSNGTLWSWGLNSSGQLGLGDTTNRTSPTQVGTDTDWVFLSADYEHSLAIKSNGTLWSWGKNNGGQLGLNDLTNRNLPTQVGSANNWTKVNAGGGHSIGIKSNGTLWTWGNNSNGQLGMGNTTSLFIPTQVGSGSNWTSVNAGGGDTLAVKSDGTLWGCGYNAFGQLGFGTNTVYELSFSQSGTSTDWKYVTTSGRSSIAAKNDDTIWSFGYGANYQLGLGMNSDVNVPTQIGSDTWQSISLSDTFGIGIKFDGTIWVWGLNGSGQLGLGTTTNQTTPLQFSCPAVLSSSSFDIASNINVYPNPTNGNVNVETNNLTNVSVSVYDLNGRQILNKELAANENAVDISNFQSGLYLFRIKSTEGETVKKVIKN